VEIRSPEEERKLMKGKKNSKGKALLSIIQKPDNR